MGSYNDFLRLHASPEAKVRRLYWVCGEEVTLREMVLERVKELADVPDFHYHSVVVGPTKEPDVWGLLNQYPADPLKRRLVIVRDAERLKNMEMLKDWLTTSLFRGSRTPGTTAVFLSNAAEWPMDHEVATREVLVKSSTALYVRCALPKDERDRRKRVQEILCGWGNIDPTHAIILAERVNFDMAEARTVMAKAAYFRGTLNARAIEALAPVKVEDDIVWSLLGLDKRRASQALQELPDTQVSRVIGALTAHVEVLGRLNGVLTRGLSVRDLSSKMNISETYARKLLPFAKLYPRKATVHRTLLLNKVDAAWQRGAREGVLEVLVAGW